MPAVRLTPNLPGSKIDAIIAAENELQNALASQGLLPHSCRAEGAIATALTALQALAAATTTPTAVAAANAIRTLYIAHIASTDAHDAADATNTISTAVCTDEATAITLINEIKGDFNAHVVRDASHRGLIGAAGSVAIATVSTSDASNPATLYALIEATRLAVERHIQAGARPISVVAS